MDKKGAPAFVAELLGTFLLVLFIGLIVVVNSGGVLNVTDWAVIGLVHLFGLALLVGALGGASGAHLNPAVTITLASMRKIRGGDAAVYILMQLAGAVLAALVVKALLNGPGAAAHYGAPAVNDTFLSGNFAGMVVEALGTFLLVGTIVGTAVIAKNKSTLAPLMIGGALGTAVMCLGPLTGAGLNPARSFGPALVGSSFNGFGTFLFVFVIGPIVGGLLGGHLVRWLYPGDIEMADAIEAPREETFEVPID